MNKLKKVFKTETWSKVGRAAKKMAKKAIMLSIYAELTGSMVIFTVYDVMYIAGMTEYIPGYMKVEQYCTAAVIGTIIFMQKEQEETRKATRRIMEQAQINDNGWKERFADAMMKGIHFFREQGNLSTIQEAKFRQIVSYSIGKMEEEMQEGK